MLKDLFPRTAHRYRNLPILGPVLDDLDDWLITRGYQPYTRRKHSRCMIGVDAYLQRQGRNTLEAITPEDLQACWQWYNHHRVHDASTVRVLHQYLDDQGRLPAPRPPPSPLYGEYVERYLQYLQTVRGLAPPTIDQHQVTATQFVEYVATQHAEYRLANLTATMMEQFITSCGRRLSRATLQHVVARVRGFVRFLALSGEVAPGLENHLDMPRLYRFEQLPRALPWETVCQLLASIDRATPIGRRDYAMLLLIATYGLRNCDIVALTLDDIRWRHAPPGTGGTKPPLFTTERQQHLVRAGVTPQADEAVGQDPTLQIRVKFLDDIRRQALGHRIGRKGGQKGLEMIRDHLVEHGATRVSRLVDRRYHRPTFQQQPLLRSPKRPLLYICALYQSHTAMSNLKDVLAVLCRQNLSLAPF